MAAKPTSSNILRVKPRRKRKGIHSKKKSRNKRSKNYKKPYSGQGR